MPRLLDLPEANRNSLLALPVPEHDGAPFVLPTGSLAASRLAIVTTAGLHQRGDRLFVGGDHTYRVFASDLPWSELAQSHTSIGFDRTASYQDLNITIPLDRLRELVERGELGGLAPNVYSFLGAQRDYRRIETESAPEVAARLKADGADRVLLTPT